MTTAEDRRTQIIRIATRLFSEKGYAQTTLDDVWAGGDCVEGGDGLTVAAVDRLRRNLAVLDRTLRNEG